jgi:hypothetical protein
MSVTPTWVGLNLNFRCRPFPDVRPGAKIPAASRAFLKAPPTLTCVFVTANRAKPISAQEKTITQSSASMALNPCAARAYGSAVSRPVTHAAERKPMKADESDERRSRTRTLGDDAKTFLNELKPFTDLLPLAAKASALIGGFYLLVMQRRSIFSMICRPSRK